MSRILFVSGWYPTEDKSSFGIFVRRHAEAAALTNDVSVLYIRTITSSTQPIVTVHSGTKNKLFEVIVSINKQKLLFPPVSFLLKLIYFIRTINKGYRVIKRHFGKPDLVHANILYEGGRQALFLKTFYGIPFVCTEHWTGYLPEDGSYSGFFRRVVSKRVAAAAKFILPVTKHLSNAMQSEGLSGSYHIVPNTVNINVFHAGADVRKNKNQIVHISSLDERQKNFTGIVRTFLKASEINQDLSLVVAGGSEKIIKQFDTGKSKIIFRGNLNESEVAKLLSESSCLILFSNFENQPCVILESLACGTPVIATRVGGISEVVNNSNGIIIEPGNENQFLEAIKKISQNPDVYSSGALSEFIRTNYSYETVNGLLNRIYTLALK
jgi:L-malate glycosyltransferase